MCSLTAEMQRGHRPLEGISTVSEQQYQNTSVRAGTCSVLDILIILSAPVLRMSLQSCPRHEHKHTNIVSFKGNVTSSTLFLSGDFIFQIMHKSFYNLTKLVHE